MLGDKRRKMKFLMKFFRKITCFKKLDHTKFTLESQYLEYKDSDYKYYYFKDVRNNRYVKVLKEENDEKLDIYTNWLNNK